MAVMWKLCPPAPAPDRLAASGGQRTLVSVALLLAVSAAGARSRVVLMDEVDAALDEHNQKSVARLLRHLAHVEGCQAGARAVCMHVQRGRAVECCVTAGVPGRGLAGPVTVVRTPFSVCLAALHLHAVELQGRAAQRSLEAPRALSRAVPRDPALAPHHSSYASPPLPCCAVGFSQVVVGIGSGAGQGVCQSFRRTHESRLNPSPCAGPGCHPQCRIPERVRRADQGHARREWDQGGALA